MLSEKVIVITGGAGLLGSSFSSAVSDNGGLVIIADKNFDSASRVAEKINQNVGNAEAAFIDITDAESIDSLIGTVHERHGRIDALVNNAYPRNKNYGRKLENVEYQDFCENLSLHLGGYFLVSQRFSLFFKGQSKGNIVNISSIYGAIQPRFEVYNGTSMTVPIEYAAIKSSINHLTGYFAQYYKKDGIRCNALSPGGLIDKQPKLFLDAYGYYCGSKGMLEPRDILGSLIFLLSDGSRYMTGQNLIVDDGFSL